jgi:WD repeat-containing protein 26
VEGSEVVHLDLTGNEVATYMFDNMDLHDVAVTPDEQRLLGVGTLTSSPSGLNPRMSKEEKRIVGGSSPLLPLHLSPVVYL